VIFRLDARLAAFSMLTVPILVGIAAVFRRMIRDAFRDVRTRLSRLNGFLQEHLQGVRWSRRSRANGWSRGGSKR